MYYAYVLESEKDRRFYYGSTRDVHSRLGRHNSGCVSATKHRRPLKLVGYISFGTRIEALQQERLFKRYKNREYVLKQLNQHGAIV